jgi:hypothetical protein
MPSTQKRIGQAQAATAKALDWWGIPSAFLNRFAPQAQKTINDITAAHPTASMGGSVASAFTGMPAVRAAGNALTNKGYGTLAQGGADAATVVGLGAAADTIRDGSPTGVSTMAASQIAAPVAMMNRVFMPNLPQEVWKRALIGAGAGTLTGLPELAINGNVNSPVLGGAIGGLMAAGGRPNPKQPSYATYRDDWAHSRMRETSRDINIGAVGALGLTGSTIPALWPDAYGGFDIPFSEMTPGAQDWYMTKDLPEWSTQFPPPHPYLPQQYDYINSNQFPPRQPSF